MSYFQGFLIPVKTEKKAAYHALAEKAAPAFVEYGATAVVENWGDDVPDGKRTDMKRAVAAEPGEQIVFSWVWWPDKATHDAAVEKIMADDRMKPDGEMPFDMTRMIFAGFEPAFDGGPGGEPGYIDGVIAPAPGDGRDAFAAHARTVDSFFIDHGALRAVDGWGIDVPKGKVTDFYRAVAAEPGEQIVFGWLEWPDKATRDAAFGAMMEDAAMRAEKPGFDMQRAIFGGFTPMVYTNHA